MAWVNKMKIMFEKPDLDNQRIVNRDTYANLNKEKPAETALQIKPLSNALHNIILIGESGAGKSTFINAIANYLSYNSLEHAKQSKLITLVGTTFLMADAEGEAQIIAACDDDNEATKNVGESATQFCKSYKFNLGNDVSIRIIDTPGINDTRGTDQDKLNFENVMKIIDACKQITAVCVMMKSDCSRFNDTFKDCLTRLFSQLHCSFNNNIVFLFSHGKGVNYEALNAMTFVKKFFKESQIPITLTRDNMLCLENDAFNYLVAMKSDLKPKIYNCDQSWDKSSEVTKNFVNYILSLKPHDVRDTVNINRTRQLIDKLADPLAEIVSFIEQCINKTEENKRVAKKSDDISKLKNIENEREIAIETVKLDKPILVCTNSNCVTYDSDGNTVHSKTCCPDCGPMKHLKSHEKYVVFERKSIFSKRFCSKCQCEEKDHRIVYFKSKISDETDDKLINRNENATDDEIIRNKEELRSDVMSKLKYRYEQNLRERNTILNALALFYYFLNANSMAKYEDKFAKENQDKINYYKGRNNKQSDGFKEISDIYEKEKKLILKQKLRGISANDLDEAKATLCNMQFNGKNIKKIYRHLDAISGNFEIVDEDCIEFPFF